MSLRKRLWWRAGIVLLCLFAASVSLADEPLPEGVTVRNLRSATTGWRVVTVDLRLMPLRIFGQAGDAQDFAELDRALATRGERLVFGMNAGIFESVDQPSGLFVQDGVLRHPINLGTGKGNFFWQPNGVFFVDAGGAHVVPSMDWRAPDGVLLATQSGPLLAADGVLHPGVAGSDSHLHVRNGVGVSDPWTVHFALSTDPVSLREMAEFLVKGLGAPDALYLDGTISALCVGTECAAPSRTWAGVLGAVQTSTIR
jgi:uncharacterized protein YigE (DUF2233 family)